MARTVTALYDSRAEAETARARLAAEVGADETRILGRDDIGALDDSGISKSEIHSFRESLLKGSHLLLAGVPAGRDPERIVALLTGVGDGPGHSATGDRLTEEARIPVAEEELRVGTKTVERGGARVHSFVQEREDVADVSRAPGERGAA